MHSATLQLLRRSFHVVDGALTVILQQVDVSMLATVVADGLATGL